MWQRTNFPQDIVGSGVINARDVNAAQRSYIRCNMQWIKRRIFVQRAYRDRTSGISMEHSAPTVISWWRHQMETFSALLALSTGNSPDTGTGVFHKGQWPGALMFSLIFVWLNGWVNNREAGDLTRHLAHYDVTVMWECSELRQVGWSSPSVQWSHLHACQLLVT